MPAEVHRWTGVCPTVALHVLVGSSEGAADDVAQVQALAAKYGLRAGSINPNVFQDQMLQVRLASAIPIRKSRQEALDHVLDSVEIAEGAGKPRSFAVVRRRIELSRHAEHPPSPQVVRRGSGATHQRLTGDQRMLVEYKPFEPAFYHTDIADWGMALLFAQSRPARGPRCWWIPGHHYQAQNIEQIVAWLLDLDMLGGFHFNDRRYADDDLTMGSIDPYQVFRIFHEIRHFEWETGKRADIAYMIDQSHNLKGKIEAMIQTVTTAMELYAKAALVDHEKLADCQSAVRAGGCRNLPEGRVLHRCASDDSRMGRVQGPAGRSDGCVPAKRLPGSASPRSAARRTCPRCPATPNGTYASLRLQTAHQGGRH